MKIHATAGLALFFAAKLFAACGFHFDNLAQPEIGVESDGQLAFTAPIVRLQDPADSAMTICARWRFNSNRIDGVRNWSVDILKSSITKLDSRTYQAILPNGAPLSLHVDEVNADKVTLMSPLGWRGSVTGKKIRIQAECGDFVLFEAGRLIAMRFKNQTLHINYNDSSVAVAKNGSTIFRADFAKSGLVLHGGAETISIGSSMYSVGGFRFNESAPDKIVISCPNGGSITLDRDTGRVLSYNNTIYTYKEIGGGAPEVTRVNADENLKIIQRYDPINGIDYTIKEVLSGKSKGTRVHYTSLKKHTTGILKGKLFSSENQVGSICIESKYTYDENAQLLSVSNNLGTRATYTPGRVHIRVNSRDLQSITSRIDDIAANIIIHLKNGTLPTAFTETDSLIYIVNESRLGAKLAPTLDKLIASLASLNIDGSTACIRALKLNIDKDCGDVEVIDV